MLSIQKREADQFAELTDFLNTEIAYVALYHDTLLQLRLDWPDPYVASLTLGSFILMLRNYTHERAAADVKALTHRQSLIRDTKEP